MAIAATKTTKKPTNVSIDRSLLMAAKSLDTNLSATLEQALVREVKRLKSEKWLDDNHEAIAASNEFVEKYGLISDKFRPFKTLALVN